MTKRNGSTKRVILSRVGFRLTEVLSPQRVGSVKYVSFMEELAQTLPDDLTFPDDLNGYWIMTHREGDGPSYGGLLIRSKNKMIYVTVFSLDTLEGVHFSFDDNGDCELRLEQMGRMLIDLVGVKHDN